MKMMMNMKMKTISVIFSVALLAGCSGHGGVLPAQRGTSLKTGNAKIVLRIPAPSTSTKYVSPSTKSLVIHVTSVNGSALSPAFPDVIMNVAPGSTQCPYPAAGSPQTCTFTTTLPVGAVAMTVTAYDQTQTAGAAVAGNVLSTAPLTQALTGNNDSVNLTLDGVPASAKLVLSAATISVGKPSTLTLTATAYDAQSNAIVGPANFDVPVTLGVSDATKRITLSAASFTAPGQSVTVSYDGALGLGAATIDASISGKLASTAGVTFEPGIISSVPIPTDYNIDAANAMGITPDGSKLVVNAPTIAGHQNQSNVALIYATGSNTLLAEIPFGMLSSNCGGCGPGPGVGGVTFSNDGQTAYLPWDSGVGGIAAFSMSTNTMTTDAINGNTSSGPQYYEALVRPGSSNLYAIAQAVSGIQVISTTDGSVTTTINGPYCEGNTGLGNIAPACMQFSSDGSTLYATYYGGYQTGGAIDVINPSTNTVTTTISTSSNWPFTRALFLAFGATSVHFSADGTKLYVSDDNNPASTVANSDDPNLTDFSYITPGTNAYSYAGGMNNNSTDFVPSPDGKYFFVPWNSTMNIVNPANGQILTSFNSALGTKFSKPVFVAGTTKFYVSQCGGSQYNSLCALQEYEY